MILGIETSGETSSVALFRDGEVVQESFFPSRMTLNQRLAPELCELVGDRAVAAGLQMVAAGIGPGSFTGVRMGVALAKALAHALSLPLAGVSAPEAIVSGLRLQVGTPVLVLQKARGEEVYATAIFVSDAGHPEECGATEVLTLEQALPASEELLGRPPAIIAGDGAALFAERITEAFSGAVLTGSDEAIPNAVEVARVAGQRPGVATGENVFALTPRYVRLSQAEREFGVDLGLSGGGHA